MPEIPAPATSTSKCSLVIDPTVPLVLGQRDREGRVRHEEGAKWPRAQSHPPWMDAARASRGTGGPASVPEFGDDSPTRPRRGGCGGEVSEAPSPGRGAARAARATKLRTVTRTLQALQVGAG